ncbi:PQQ-binding-like beta-propeller repeat protein [Streptomyces sp. NBC_00433]
MPSIFVSFRKIDNRWMRDRVYQALAEAFGANEIFKSGESIPAGGDFAAILRRQAAECKLMLVLIGTAWTDARDAGGRRLLDRHDDWVRVEIATALAAGNRVIPVLLGDAAMLPAPVALPDDIAELAQLQFLRVPETHLEEGLQRFATAVSGLLPDLPTLGSRSEEPTDPAAVPPPAVPAVTQHTGSGNAVSVQGGMERSRVAGRDIRETKIHTGGILATITAFLTSKAGIAAAAAVTIGIATTIAATTTRSSGGTSDANAPTVARQGNKAVQTAATGDSAQGRPWKLILNASTPSDLVDLPIAYATLSGSMIYAADYVDARVYALDAHSGAEKWMKDVTDLDPYSALPPAFDDGVLYLRGRDKLIALDAATGTQRWTKPVGSTGLTPLTGAVAAAGSVYVGSGAGQLYSFDEATGRSKWTFTGVDVSAPVTVADGEVYIPDSAGKIYIVSAATGKQQSVLATARDAAPSSENQIITRPLVAKGAVYCASYHGWGLPLSGGHADTGSA